MGSIVIAPGAGGGGGAGASNILGTWFDPDIPYSFGTLAAIADATAGVDHVGESGLFHNAQRNFNLASFVSVISDGLGGYMVYQTGTVANNDAWVSTAGAQLTAAPGCDFIAKFRTDADIQDRAALWFGFGATGPGAGWVATGDPGPNHAVLRFRTNTINQFQFVSRGNTGQQVSNTSVVPAGNEVFYIRIQVRSSEVTFTLYDDTFTAVAGPTVHTTQFPTDNTPMYALCMSWQEVAADRDLMLYFCHVGQRHIEVAP